MRARALGLVLLLSSNVRTQADEPAQVTLPLAQYEALRKGAEASRDRAAAVAEASLTIVETARLSGRFRGGPLSITFQGRSTGARPAVPLVTLGGNLQLSGCKGSALVSRGEDEALVLTPLAANVELTCRLSGLANDRLELTLSSHVLGFELDVKDAEIASQHMEEGARVLAVAWIDPDPQVVPPTATGRYLLSLHPDETRFRYELDVRNANRSRQPFEVTIPAGETVQQVEGPAYEARGPSFRFDVAPGDSKVVLHGTRHGTSFRPAVEASVQFALVEAHPLLRCRITTTSRRISPSETGLTPTFRGSEAFLVKPGEILSWVVSPVDALKSDAFGVDRAQHLAFVPADGSLLLESRFALQNRGAAELALALDGTPRYAGIDANPTLLRAGKDGLSLPLSPGAQTVTVQSSRSFREGLGLGFLSFRVPRVAVPVGTSGVEIRYAARWLPLFESFGSERSFAWPRDATLFWFVLLALAAERALCGLGLARRERIALAALVSGSALTSAVLFQLAWIAVLSAGVAYGLSRLPRVPVTSRLVAGGVALFVVLFLGIGAFLRYRELLARVSYTGQGALGGGYEATLGILERIFMPPFPPWMGSRRVEVAPLAAAAPASYQGLPTKIEMPEGTRRTSLSRDLLSAEASPSVRALVVSTTLVWWLTMGLYAALLAALVRTRLGLIDGVKALLKRHDANVGEPVGGVTPPEPASAA